MQSLDRLGSLQYYARESLSRPNEAIRRDASWPEFARESSRSANVTNFVTLNSAENRIQCHIVPNRPSAFPHRRKDQANRGVERTDLREVNKQIRSVERTVKFLELTNESEICSRFRKHATQAAEQLIVKRFFAGDRRRTRRCVSVQHWVPRQAGKREHRRFFAAAEHLQQFRHGFGDLARELLFQDDFQVGPRTSSPSRKTHVSRL